MNILFLSLCAIDSINTPGIYTDLLREFIRHGHVVFALSPVETKIDRNKALICDDNVKIVRVATGEIQKARFLEKGINTIFLERRFIKAIRVSLSDVSFDLVLYPTPPVTLVNAVRYVKKRDNAKTYLMLKDIFPQNAVDIGLMSKRGFTGLLYEYFRRKEKKLYDISDRIGCMSQANIDYVVAHNPKISTEKVELCPNSIEVQDLSLSESEREQMRKKYRLPLDKRIFVYGGNLGKPQGISFLIDCLKTQLNNPDAFFLIVGNGTEFGKLQAFFNKSKPENMRLMSSIPKEDYDRMIAACDVGMIFLDHRFTIPNFPSRLLSYMQARLPVLACTDLHTDIGKVIVNGSFGWWCESNETNRFQQIISNILATEINEMGNNGFKLLNEKYSTAQSYKIITESIIRGEKS